MELRGIHFLDIKKRRGGWRSWLHALYRQSWHLRKRGLIFSHDLADVLTNPKTLLIFIATPGMQAPLAPSLTGEGAFLGRPCRVR